MAPAHSPPELPRHLRYDHEAVERYLRSYALARLIRAVVHHADRLPDGPALLVGNHSPLAIDTGLLIHALLLERGRVVRALGDRLLFTNPVGRQMARSVAGVEGNPENARALLKHGEWVLVYPGGARETLRAPEDRYQLDWEGRFGFARTALEAQVPIVPVACIGADDLLTQVVDRETVLGSFVGKLASRFIRPDYIPPIYVPKLRPTQFHYFLGDAIPPSPRADARDEQAVRAHQALVKAALEALLEHGRAVRRERLSRKQEQEAEQP
jgi:1-acyl-sn-glycerol-3-phosphate acyltransferase